MLWMLASDAECIIYVNYIAFYAIDRSHRHREPISLGPSTHVDFQAFTLENAPPLIGQTGHQNLKTHQLYVYRSMCASSLDIF